MIDFSSTDCSSFIAFATGSDLLTVEAVLDAEFQLMFGLGLVDGPEPAWTVIDPLEMEQIAEDLLMGTHNVPHTAVPLWAAAPLRPGDRAMRPSGVPGEHPPIWITPITPIRRSTRRSP